MKKFIFAISLILILTSTSLITGCAQNITLAAPVSREFNITDFTGIELGHTTELGVQFGEIEIPIEFDVTRSDTYKVNVTANENIFDFIDVSKSGSALKMIINRQKIGTANATIKVQISLPELSGIKMNGVRVNMTATVLSSASEFDVDVSGAGHLYINMQTDKTEFRISTSGNVIARGSTGDLNADVSGDGNLDMNMQNNNVTLKVSTSGHVIEKGSAQDYDVDVSRDGSLDIDMETNNASFNTSMSGSVTGQLNCADIGIESSGASRIELEGSGGNANIQASSNSNIVLPDFTLKDASISLRGASEGNVNVNGQLDVNLNSNSTLTYSGNPVTGDINVSGDSKLIRK
jgi:hypothetical protein